MATTKHHVEYLDKVKLYLEACVPQGSSQFLKKQRFCILIFLSYDGILLGQTRGTEIRSTHCAPGSLMCSFNNTSSEFHSCLVL